MGGIKINTPQQLDFLIKHLIDERDEEIIIPNDIDDKKLLFRSLVNVRPPLEVSDEFLQVQDEFLTNETLNKNLTSAEDISEVKGKLALWQGDITTLKVDAIVNAANSKLLGCFIPLHNCIDNVIHSSAGIQLRQECSEIMRRQGHNEEVGKAKITGAYNLPSRHVIHTVGPAIPYGAEPSSDDCEKLASCYESCLELASYNELKSIAFCSISTGVFNFPQQKAAEIAIKTVEDYLNENESSLEKVIFDTFSDKSYLIYKNLLFGGGQFMDKFVLRLDKAVDAIDDADYVLIGAGAGFSAAAGLEYSGKRFEDNFTDFIEKYGVTDMYSATFYPYETQEAKWGHWARHVYVNRYSVGKTKLYEQLLDLMNDKDYFVLTTNVDHQFWINGFEDKRIFATQGDYGLMQCETACHDKLYSNKKLVFEAIENTQDCMIPSELVPVCPVCGGNMEINVRKDNCFVEDEKWHEMYGNYSKFLENIGTDDRLVLLELGVGFNTPVIIRYPFEHMTHDNPNVNLIRLNRSYAQAIPENKDKTISFDEEISEIFNYWTKRI